MKTEHIIAIAALGAVFLVTRRAQAAPARVAEHTALGTFDDYSPMLQGAAGVPFWQTAPFTDGR